VGALNKEDITEKTMFVDNFFGGCKGTRSIMRMEEYRRESI
jgi:hypothetical protein